MKPGIELSDLRKWFADATNEELAEFLDQGLEDLINELEEDDFFGTEGFNKRFS